MRRFGRGRSGSAVVAHGPVLVVGGVLFRTEQSRLGTRDTRTSNMGSSSAQLERAPRHIQTRKGSSGCDAVDRSWLHMGHPGSSLGVDFGDRDGHCRRLDFDTRRMKRPGRTQHSDPDQNWITSDRGGDTFGGFGAFRWIRRKFPHHFKCTTPMINGPFAGNHVCIIR